MCKIWNLGSLFITAGAERCGTLTFGRVESEVKSNTNKVETLIMAFMDVAGTAPSDGGRESEGEGGGKRKKRIINYE